MSTTTGDSDTNESFKDSLLVRSAATTTNAAFKPFYTTIPASPLFPTAGSPWGNPMNLPQPQPQPSTILTIGGSSNASESGSSSITVDDDSSVGIKSTDKTHYNLDIDRVVSPLAAPTTLHEEEVYKSFSPAESRTTCSSYCTGTEQQIVPTTTTTTTTTPTHHTEHSLHVVTGQNADSSTTASRQLVPKQWNNSQAKRQHRHLHRHHVFVSLPAEGTSDPEDRKRRKEARAQEQQQLILERVQATREEKRAKQKKSSVRFPMRVICVCVCVQFECVCVLNDTLFHSWADVRSTPFCFWQAAKSMTVLQDNKRYGDGSTRSTSHGSIGDSKSTGIRTTKDSKNVKKGRSCRGRRKNNCDKINSSNKDNATTEYGKQQGTKFMNENLTS